MFSGDRARDPELRREREREREERMQPNKEYIVGKQQWNCRSSMNYAEGIGYSVLIHDVLALYHV